MAIKLGKPAPEFTLFSDEKKEVNLSDFKGKNVVILFFPQAFTGVCTQELCDMRDNMHKYEALNAQVLGISVDSVFTLAKFKELQNYNFPLLSDFNKQISKKYGTIYKEFAFGMSGVSKRSAFVLDAEGIVRYAEVLDNAGNVPSFKAINETLAGL
jgi:glutaredoxin-dependent peroxiredoxin